MQTYTKAPNCKEVYSDYLLTDNYINLKGNIPKDFTGTVKYCKDSLVQELVYFVDGKRNGIWVQFNEIGIKISESFWKDGHIVGTAKRWYDDGSILEEVNFDKQYEKQFHINGALQSNLEWDYLPFKDSLIKLENQKTYSIDGKLELKRQSFLSGNNLTEKCEYYENNKIVRTHIFVNNNLFRCTGKCRKCFEDGHYERKNIKFCDSTVRIL
jgi:antitoxin component YwqK of YwqJK toxin-antitoxin module